MNLRMYLRLPTHRELQTVSLRQQLPSQQQFLEPQLLPVQQVQQELPGTTGAAAGTGTGTTVGGTTAGGTTAGGTTTGGTAGGTTNADNSQDTTAKDKDTATSEDEQTPKVSGRSG